MTGLTHVLFDFFGTLVAYSASRVEQGFQRSHGILVAAGSRLDYTGFLAEWEGTSAEFERRAQHSLDEYSMDDVCKTFLGRVLPRTPKTDVVALFRNSYLEEWNKGVSHIRGVTSLLADLSDRFTLVLVTNTHHADLVHGHLRMMDAAQYFSTVVTSVEHRKRKPSRSIFENALARSGGKAEASVYVGDSHSADYVGAVSAGLRCLLIDPKGQHDVPASARLTHVLDVAARLAS